MFAVATIELSAAFSNLPVHIARRGINNRISCQMEPKEEIPLPIEISAKPVATGGTDFSKLPKKQISPIFWLPSKSIAGRGDLVGDLGFDPIGFAEVKSYASMFLLCKHT
jgi:hypothetical protein